MTLAEFLVSALELDPPYRRGQSLMNKLYSVRPDLYASLKDDLNINAFYDDSDFWAALSYIRDNWDAAVQSPPDT